MIKGKLVIDLSHLDSRYNGRVMTRDSFNYFSHFEYPITIQEANFHREIARLVNVITSIKYEGARAIKLGQEIQEMAASLTHMSSPESLIGCTRALNRISDHFKIDIK